MRVVTPAGDFRAKAIAGTHTVLIALDYPEARRSQLMGFAFKREIIGAANLGPKWLRSLKVFKSIVPDPKNARDPHDSTKPARFSTWEHPIQSFLWSDYTAQPNTPYRFTVVPMHGQPGALQPQPGLTFEIRTEKELDQGHGVWFNRGAIASQAFAREFGNTGPLPPENPDPNDRTTKWLSRGLLEACLRFINDTPAGDGLRVAAYEFTYKPVLDALKAALDRGVDLRIIYHNTTSGGEEKGANEKAIEKSGLPKKVGTKQVLFARTKTKIPHNKFIVRLEGGAEPTSVWTGSTNFTPSGFLGQTNVGHLVADATTAKQYLAYWQLLKKDPDRDSARVGAMKLTKNPPALIPAKSIARVFSPRPKSDLLTWYGKRIQDAVGTVMFTAAFGVTKALVGPLAKDRDFLRFILMEKPPTEKVKLDLTKDRDLIIGFGAVLGEMYTFKNGEPIARKKIKEFQLDKWFLKEDHFRHEGFVFFVHTKFLLIDPLSDDPLVCSGSANFSPDSLLQNDENMLLIRGDTRVADIYLTEFDRIFRHFYFRDVANEIEARGGEAKGAFLDETSKWTNSYFRPGAFKTRRQEMFFSDPTNSWVANAAQDDA
jgi:phosphatidylserine/phosphatidylglycerophosphate/cardiolipin synthase-like enzyme